jgi:hypothetical protein
MDETDEIKVFMTTRNNSKCGECGEDLGPKAWITLEEEKGVLAHIRHRETNYDEFLGQGFDRHHARTR